MKIIPLNFNRAPNFCVPIQNALVFIRPLHSLLFRVQQMPPVTPEKTTELRQVLTSICTKYKNGVWYFVAETGLLEDTINILMEMEISPVFVSLDADEQMAN